MMIRFNCDYSETAHPDVMRKILEAAGEQNPGYGEDEHCARAAALIRAECACPEAEVLFMSGGTQANLIITAAALRPHQGVLCAASGHINTHESGAIEATGHKVMPIPSADGKISAADVRRAWAEHYADESRIHTVQPKMVYVSHPTELGTLYAKAELEAIAAVCREKDLILFLDGARLGYGLTAPGADLALPDIARLCDVFYIGGTKVGAMFGEAVALRRPELREDFKYLIKQRGGMLAKGFLLGLQFEALFENGLYCRLGARANETAGIIRAAFADAGHDFLCDSPTNQQFPILPDAMLRHLAGRYSWASIARMDGGRTATRFCTSWATAMEDAQALAEDVRAWRG